MHLPFRTVHMHAVSCLVSGARLMVHGDDFVAVGSPGALDDLEALLKEHRLDFDAGFVSILVRVALDESNDLATLTCGRTTRRYISIPPMPIGIRRLASSPPPHLSLLLPSVLPSSLPEGMVRGLRCR